MDEVALQRRRVIGANIAHYRQAAGLSQRRLGLMLDTTADHVWKWERGWHEPRPATLKRIARTLQVPVDALRDETAHTDQAA